MKRFKLNVPNSPQAVIIVDDEDAYRLRSELWYARNSSRSGRLDVYRKVGGVVLALAREILGVTDEQHSVVFRDGDPTNFRRANLVVIESKFQLALARITGHSLMLGYCDKGHNIRATGEVWNKSPSLPAGGVWICAACYAEKIKRSTNKRREKRKHNQELIQDGGV